MGREQEHQDQFDAARARMVLGQIQQRGIDNPRLISVLRRVPRHLFVPAAYQQHAYEDHPLPIGFGQTISQPYMVAAMTDLLHLQGDENVLEVGTGSGYQAAVLAEMASTVDTIERIPELAERARRLLEQLGYQNARVHTGDGGSGWPANAPYHAILVTAAAPHIPPPLAQQLAGGGRLVIPVGGPHGQDLEYWRKENGSLQRRQLFPVAFVPLRGPMGWDEEEWHEQRKTGDWF